MKKEQLLKKIFHYPCDCDEAQKKCEHKWEQSAIAEYFYSLGRNEAIDEALKVVDTLEVTEKPTHAEENGYGWALEDLRTALTELKK